MKFTTRMLWMMEIYMSNPASSSCLLCPYISTIIQTFPHCVFAYTYMVFLQVMSSKGNGVNPSLETV